ncbi:MAG: hypothetical protein JWP44_4395 [Mucilaginibacter sp.]|nr:hypothetical protein [Mucilaginibacter sp.]
MQRFTIEPRQGWQKKVEDQGLIWHTIDGISYWHESAYFTLSKDDVKVIKEATETLYQMFLKAGEYIISNNLFSDFGIPEYIIPRLVDTWRKEPPALNFGRFDLGYNGDGKPKLFEFNCDTPTGLLEASVVQWFWKEDKFPAYGQANEIHEYLGDKWKDVAKYLPDTNIHIMATNDPIGEDVTTATYMAELATEAGLRPQFITPEDIGWDNQRQVFVDLNNKQIRIMYKLYPWEWMLQEEFGRNIPKTNTLWIEPVWKAMWSNKAILPVLWKLYPNHPLLLESSIEPLSKPHVVKPIFGREGRGVRFSTDVSEIQDDELLGKNIYQEKFDIKPTEGGWPVIGSWIVDGNFAGIGVREGEIITGNTSRFVPHIIE